MTKTPAELAASNYCDIHGLYFERFCPDCQLERWDTFNRVEKPLERVDA